MTEKYLDYLNAVSYSLSLTGPIYYGREGALRLAREVGWCLKDLDSEEAEKAIRDSYNYVCIKGYNLSPPIDKKEWDTEVRNSYQKEGAVDGM